MSRTESSGSAKSPSHAPCKSRVEEVAQAVPEKIDGEHHRGQRHAGTEYRPRRPFEIKPRRSNHVPPAWNFWRRSGAKEGERGLDQDGRRADVGRLDKERRDSRWQDMAK